MKGLKVAVLAIGVLLFLSSSAHAYLDPGSGSMVLQVLLGGVAAVAVVVKLMWHRILTLLHIRKDDSPEESESNSSSGTEG
ncbi:MAG TPA: hypothetical protein VLH08_01800 [Acidobacteriota bacterium]|nr:hypothetical protein [Acidobacteriota bacterium]